MITASLGSHRFESGPTYHFNGSGMSQLIDTMFDPAQTTDHVNTLPRVEATPEEIQQVATAGIVRLAVDQSDYSLIPEAGEVLLDVCRGEVDAIPTDIFQRNSGWSERTEYRIRGSLTNATLDSASVLATRRNKPEETAGIIGERVDMDEGVFVIGLANGGVISTAHTFLQLPDGDHELSFVRYSRNKYKDSEPKMHPYPDDRKRALRRSAESRQIVIHDEDYASGETLKTAVDFFAELFDKEVVGIAPVMIGRRIEYDPLVITSN